jgi:sulfite exporter TauE/SafE
MINLFLEPGIHGFMLGLSAGPLCFTGCFPMLLSVTISEGKTATRGSGAWVFLGKFMGGRFIAYLVFGFFIGLVGAQLGGWGHWIGTYALIVLSGILIAYGLGVHLPHVGLCRIAGRTAGNRFFPYILGGLTGLNVCPPFLLAIAYILQRGVNPAFGVIFFMAFFLASSLYILPVGFAGYLPHRELIARIGKLATVVVGVVFFYQGIRALMLG